MSDITFLDFSNSILTASQVDKDYKYFGILNDNICYFIKKNNSSESSLVLGNNLTIKQIEIDSTNGKIYLKCNRNTIDDLNINNQTYSSTSLNPFIILNSDITIDRLLWIDGIISYFVSNNTLQMLLLIDEYSRPSVAHTVTFPKSSAISNTNTYIYYYYKLEYSNYDNFNLTEIISGGNEISKLFNNICLLNEHIILTGFINQTIYLNIDNITINLYGSNSLILSIYLDNNNQIKYNYHELISGIYINKVLPIFFNNYIYILCDMKDNAILFDRYSFYIKIDSVYKYKKAVIGYNVLTKEGSIVHVTQSNNNTDVYITNDKNNNLYYVTQTDENGSIIINNELYKTNKLRQLVIKTLSNNNLTKTSNKLKWIKELKGEPINNNFVKNIFSIDDKIIITGIANEKSLSLGNINYNSNNNQNKIYTLEFTNIEEFTNINQDTEFTPYETLDLIHEYKKTIEEPQTSNNNKTTVIVLGTFLGLSLLTILILVLLYLHFVKKLI